MKWVQTWLGIVVQINIFQVKFKITETLWIVTLFI